MQQGSVRPAVDAIWAALGLAPPPERIAEHYGFDVENTALVLRLAPNGTTILLEGTLGSLSTDPTQAADQMRRLMRIGLGLAAFNGAALVVPEGADRDSLAALLGADRDARPALRVLAVARVAPPAAKSAVAALQDILQWQSYAEPILSERAYATAGRPAPQRGQVEDDGSFLIFQP